MLTLRMIKDWLKTLGLDCENFYIGKLDNKKEKSIGTYSSKKKLEPYIAIGGLFNTSFKKKAITFLIHWNKNQNGTELASALLYSKLEAKTDIVVEGVKVKYIQLLDNEPIDIGTDDNGVYEMVISAVFYYEKEA